MTDPLGRPSEITRRSPPISSTSDTTSQFHVTTRLVSDAIEISKQERNQQIEKSLVSGALTRNQYTLLKNFEKKLNTNRQFVQTGTEMLGPAKEHHEFKISEKIMRRIKTCVKFGLGRKESIDLFKGWREMISIQTNSQWSNALNVELHLNCVHEQIMNKITGRILFLNEMQMFIEAKKEQIVHTLKEIEPASLKKIQFNYEIAEGGDSHNGGKIPVKVIFFWTSPQGKQELIVYYKPRLARTDYLIVDAFRELACLPFPESLSLPFYKIIPFPDNQCSIWEHVPGEVGKIDEYETAGGLILSRYSFPPTDKDIKSVKMLQDLEYVCSYLNITDLHIENCIFQADGAIVPIDLEVINQDSTHTFLTSNQDRASFIEKQIPWSFGIPEQGEMSFSEHQTRILQRTQVSLSAQVKRAVPLNTRMLYEAFKDYLSFSISEDTHIPLIVEDVEKGIEKLGYRLSGNRENFIQNMIKDFLKGEVSFFTVYGENMYHGTEIRPENIVGFRPSALRTTGVWV